jgi:ATP-dependent Clp protease ATP-binding subunit ClpA
LPVLDDGRLTDARGKVVSFRNTIVIATSNAGAEFIREHIQDHDSAGLLKESLLDYLQSQGIYTPELINRFDDTIVFDPLTGDEQIEVTKLMLASLAKYLLEQDITLSYDDSLLAFIAEHGANNQFGARPLRPRPTASRPPQSQPPPQPCPRV